MPLKPWYQVVYPREDLREDRPLDASEFAVHLEQVRDNAGPDVYRVPAEFFKRTFLTRNLITLAAETVRRLNGENTEASAVFNLATQFGGGKTHALTLLYHLAKHGPASLKWAGVQQVLDAAGMRSIPACDTAIFVGTEFDAIKGRGGDDGTPLRKTPWGEIAWQLGGEKVFKIVAQHDAEGIAPAGDVLRDLLPKGKPHLILMDELMNFTSKGRKTGMATQLYHFLHSLSETARDPERQVVLVVSIPASLLEMTPEDESDFTRYKKMLDRVGKPIMMSSESEAAEIIRRRLFEWDKDAIGRDGKVVLDRKALETCGAFANWVVEHRQQIPGWFPVDQAADQFKATYPFHPMVLSVFERKWQTLPRFQRTRGVLRMLALWVSKAYKAGYEGAHRDPLIGMGTAPLEESMFRSVVFEQLDEEKLEAAVTTDICGKTESHAARLDQEAVDAIKKNRLHRKSATIIFFESNGGTTKDEATVPEIRLALAEPDVDAGHLETVLEALETSCYYLAINKNRYRFSLAPNLNKMLADRRANIDAKKINEQVRAMVQTVFAATDPSVPAGAVDRRYFPEMGSHIPNKPVLTFAILPPDQTYADKDATLSLIAAMTKECGASARTFKSAIVWCFADATTPLENEARRLLAWEEIRDDEIDRLDEDQKRQLTVNVEKARRDLREAAWRAYRYYALLGKDNAMRVADMGLVNSSMCKSMAGLVLEHLRKEGEVELRVGPNFITRNWSPAFVEWSTKAIRDAFFASPTFPKLLNAEDAIRNAISDGVKGGQLAYVGKRDGGYDPFWFKDSINPLDIEIADDVYVVKRETAEAFIKAKAKPQFDEDNSISAHTVTVIEPQSSERKSSITFGGVQPDLPPVPPIETGVKTLRWTGQIPPQKWMNFYTKVLSHYATSKELKLSLNVEIHSKDGISSHQIEDTKSALRELGLADDIQSAE